MKSIYCPPLKGGEQPNTLPLEGELNQIPSPLRGEGQGGGEKWTGDGGRGRAAKR